MNGEQTQDPSQGKLRRSPTRNEYLDRVGPRHIDESLLKDLARAVIVTDHQGRIHNMNPAAKQLLGDPGTELALTDWPEAFGLYRDDGAGFFPVEALPPIRALRDLKEVPPEFMILRQGNGLRDRRISMSSRPIPSDNGGTPAIATLIQEISDRSSQQKSAEVRTRQAEELGRFREVFVDSSRDVQQIARSVAELVSEVLGDLSAVALLEPGTGRLTLSAFHDTDPEFGARFVGLAASSVDYLNGESLEAELSNGLLEPSRRSDAQPAALRLFGRFMEEMQVPGMIMAPLLGRTGVLGSIAVFSHPGRAPYTAGDRAFIVDIAHRTALSIENCLLAESLQAEISARLSAAQALDISEQRFQSIFESTSLGIKVLDLNGNILQTNGSFQKIIGYSEAEILGRRFYDFLHPADITPAVSTFHKLKTEGVPSLRFQHRAIHKGGATVWVNAIFSAVRKGGGDPSLAFIVSILEDVTEQKLVESEMSELKNRLQTTMELERLRLAHELHDGPMQELYSVIYELEELRSKTDPEMGNSLKHVSQNVRAVLQELRTTAKDLRPPTISQFGLEKTIRSYAGDLQDRHPELKVHLSLARDHQLLPEEVRLALFRIFQQSINNIVRHADASEVRVRFTFDAEEARLEVSDNGKGFDVPANWIELVREGHFGLAGSAERANALGGTFMVASKQAGWTTVRAIIPWKEQLE